MTCSDCENKPISWYKRTIPFHWFGIITLLPALVLAIRLGTPLLDNLFLILNYLTIKGWSGFFLSLTLGMLLYDNIILGPRILDGSEKYKRYQRRGYMIDAEIQKYETESRLQSLAVKAMIALPVAAMYITLLSN